MKKALVVLVASVVLGTWLAALPYGENDPCRYSDEDGSGATWSMSYWPAGHVCHVFSAPQARTFDEFHRPSVPATLVWILLAGVLVAAAINRRTPATRGAVLGLTTLALVSLALQLAGDFVPAVFLALVYGAPITLAVDWFLRMPGTRSLLGSALTVVIVPPIVVFAWSIPYLWRTDQMAAPVGVLAGTLALLAGRRLQPTLRSWGLA